MALHSSQQTESPVQLFSLVLDFRGGTYISQVRAQTPKEAIKLGIRGLEVDAIDGVTLQDTDSMLLGLEDEEDGPTPLGGLTNIWCMSFLIRDELALVNMVKTIES